MLAIVDHRAPPAVINHLSVITDELLLFRSEGVTYESISGHPDIFVYQDENHLVVAPNAPHLLFEFLRKKNIDFIMGECTVGISLKDSVLYNCLSTPDHFFHKKGHTDRVVIELNKEKRPVYLPQAYTRCSLIHVANNKLITSDKGIYTNLMRKELDVFFFSPGQIRIVGHNHGFIGGTAGFYQNTLYFMGNIDLHTDGMALRKFVESAGVDIKCLADCLLYDGGGIFLI